MHTSAETMAPSANVVAMFRSKQNKHTFQRHFFLYEYTVKTEIFLQINQNKNEFFFFKQKSSVTYFYSIMLISNSSIIFFLLRDLFVVL